MQGGDYMEENGVWRTVGGRRIFIKDGQDLASAMKGGNYRFGRLLFGFYH